ncbi:MAG: F0F1 ATP synthase subunit A [Coriobacteriia bacterium]|nr:F0F1 ATP synthase subunit A [Coriobacteriia bacterium]
MEAEKTAIEHFMPYIVVGNAALVGVGLVALAKVLGSRELSEDVPEGRQNVGEFILDFFVGKARDMGHGEERARIVRQVAPFLATCFLFIFGANLMGVLPLPVLNNPPTSYFSVTLALALSAVLGTLVFSGIFQGIGGAVKHLFWPNPMEWIAKVTDVFSLSLRLFGNIGGEHMTLVLVMGMVPVGIPLILHTLGLIPAFVQALVFTLLTSSFIAGAIHHEEKKAKASRRSRFKKRKAEESVETAPAGV